MAEPKANETRGDGAAPSQSAQVDAGTAVLDDLETLRARAGERDQFLALLQRTKADFENYQKRMQREMAQERRYSHGSLAQDLLPVLDNLERATAAAKQAGETGPLVQGVAMVQSQMLDLLKRHGITPSRPWDSHSIPTCSRPSCSNPLLASRLTRCCKCWNRGS